jgi:L-asparaginase
MAQLPRILMLGVGGTIHDVGESAIDLAWYEEASKRLGVEELVQRVPEMGAIASIRAIDVRELASPALSTEDLLMLARVVQVAVDEGDVDGVVVTHGTATLEETAFFLHLVVQGEIPVVVVGALRPASALSPDGPLNLLNAVKVAGDPASRGLGVLVVLNDTVYSARDVTKGSTYRLHAFEARDTGPLGYADVDGIVVYYHRPARARQSTRLFDISKVDKLPRTDIVVSYLGADGLVIDALTAAGSRGIVSAGSGSGRPTPLEVEALQRASTSGVVVCVSSRTGSGRVVISPLLRQRQWVAAGNLIPWKARLLLALALTATDDIAEIQEMFREHG